MRLRPFPVAWLAAALALAVGEAIGFSLSGAASFWPVAAVGAALVAAFGYGFQIRGWPVACLVFVGLALSMASEHRRLSALERVALENERWESELTVERVLPVRGEWVSFLASEKGVDLKVIFKLSESGGVPERGEVWRCAGWIDRREPTDRSRRNVWVRGKNCFAERVSLAPFYCLNGFRARLSDIAGRGLDEGVAALNRAMLLGERMTLSRETKKRFITAGTLHVFAISGLHVGVIGASMVVLMMLIFVPYRLSCLLLLPLLWAYVLMIGSPPSAVRAALMGSFYFASVLVWRRPYGLVAWAQSFVLVHLISPERLFSPGSLLSFAVMLGLLLFDYWSHAVELPRWVEPFGFVVAAWLAGLPIGVEIFGRVTFGGLLANLVAVPLAGIAVACGFLGLVSGLVIPVLGVHLNNAAGLAIRAMDGVSAAVSRLPFASFEVEPWGFWTAVGIYAVILGVGFLVWSIRRRTRQVI